MKTPTGRTIALKLYISIFCCSHEEASPGTIVQVSLAPVPGIGVRVSDSYGCTRRAADIVFVSPDAHFSRVCRCVFLNVLQALFFLGLEIGGGAGMS